MAVNSLVRGAAALFILIAASTTAARAGQDRFVVDLASEPSTLDPHIQWNPDSYFVYRNIFDNLLTRDDKGAIVPEIATAWRQVSDTTLEFDIRTDVSFHDGSKLTAEDVVFSIKRIIDPKFGSPQLSQFSKIADATRDGPSKVVIQLKSPYSAILAQLVKLSIVPKHVVEKEGNDKFNLNPIGSGPYKFISWDRGVAVTLARNDAYWGRKGPFPQAVFRAVPNAATRLADVQASAADLARAMNSDQGKQLDDSGRGKRLYALTERSAYLRINPNRPPFDNLKIRQALSYAIDKEGITEGILGGLDKPIDEMVTPVNCALAQVIYGLEQANLRPGDAFVTQGAGGLGLNAVAVARAMGARPVIAIDTLPGRLELAERFGADETVLVGDFESVEDRVAHVRGLTDGIGANVVADFVGMARVIPEGIAMTRNGGTYLEVGTISPPDSFELHPSQLVRGNKRITGVLHYNPWAIASALDFLQRNRDVYPFAEVISHSFPLDRIDEAFSFCEWSGRDECQVVRGVLVP